MDTQFASHLVGRITDPLARISKYLSDSLQTQKEILQELRKLNAQQGEAEG
jgi:hypothetical protein